MDFAGFRFGSICIDGVDYGHDVVIDHGHVRRRRKKPSRRYRDAFGHTPLSTAEELPWDCQQLVIGTGAQGALPVMADVEREARRRGVELIVLRTDDAIAVLAGAGGSANAVLHVTC
jgi:hypothetical protein